MAERFVWRHSKPPMIAMLLFIHLDHILVQTAKTASNNSSICSPPFSTRWHNLHLHFRILYHFRRAESREMFVGTVA
ncbi:MAG TPA: hypothetical protein PLJ44_05010 [Victivallales bacterium]|nr:hypothetical protein [Victivallales bacterium]